jgi:hypothetical protein
MPILMLITATIKNAIFSCFLILMFISNGLSAMATSLEQPIVFRFLSGLPLGVYCGAAIVLAADIAALNITGIAIVCSIIFPLAYVRAYDNIWLLYRLILFIGCSVGLAALIQALLMDISPNDQVMIGA